MNDIDTELLRESFESQLSDLANGKIPYPEIFVDDKKLKEDLFIEYCSLEPEPDIDVFTNAQLRKEGIEIWDQDGKLNYGLFQKNESHINNIHKLFRDDVVEGKINPQHCRPQLEGAMTIKRLEEIDEWQNDLVNLMAEKDLDTVISRMHPILNDITENILKNLRETLSNKLASRICGDDLFNRMETLLITRGLENTVAGWEIISEFNSQLDNRPKRLTDLEVEKRIKRAKSNWRHVRSMIQIALKEFLLEQKNMDTEETVSPENITRHKENDVLMSTIDEYLEEFKPRISPKDYETLITGLYSYFKTGGNPTPQAPLKTGKITKKALGWALNQLYRSEKDDAIPLSYLEFIKQHISLFSKDLNKEKDKFQDSRLYKYLTQKPQ